MSISINTLYDFNGLITFVNLNNLIKHSLLFVCFSFSFINARIIYIFPLHYIIYYMSLICQMKSYFKNFCDVHITFCTKTEKQTNQRKNQKPLLLLKICRFAYQKTNTCRLRSLKGVNFCIRS